MLNKKLNNETADSTLRGHYSQNFIYVNKSEEKVTWLGEGREDT